MHYDASNYTPRQQHQQRSANAATPHRSAANDTDIAITQCLGVLEELEASALVTHQRHQEYDLGMLKTLLEERDQLWSALHQISERTNGELATASATEEASAAKQEEQEEDRTAAGDDGDAVLLHDEIRAIFAKYGNVFGEGR